MRNSPQSHAVELTEEFLLSDEQFHSVEDDFDDLILLNAAGNLNLFV